MTAPGQSVRTASMSDDVHDPLVVAKLVGAWTFVGIPLAWGVWQVVVKSLALFR
jgi:hypothetical protein